MNLFTIDFDLASSSVKICTRSQKNWRKRQV